MSASNLETVLGLEWARQLLSPVDTIRRALREKYQKDWGRLVRKFWAFPITLSFAANAVLFHLYGINVTAEFSFLYPVFFSLRQFADALLIHWILKMFGMKSDLGAVFVCYTISIIYAPIVSCLSLTDTYNQISLLKNIKDQHLDLLGSFHYYVGHILELSKTSIPTPVSISYIRETIGIISDVLVAECLTQSFNNDRFRTYVAVWTASLISLAPAIVLSAPQLLIMFVYIK